MSWLYNLLFRSSEPPWDPGDVDPEERAEFERQLEVWASEGVGMVDPRAAAPFDPADDPGARPARWWSFRALGRLSRSDRAAIADQVLDIPDQDVLQRILSARQAGPEALHNLVIEDQQVREALAELPIVRAAAEQQTPIDQRVHDFRLKYALARRTEETPGPTYLGDRVWCVDDEAFEEMMKRVSEGKK